MRCVRGIISQLPLEDEMILMATGMSVQRAERIPAKSGGVHFEQKRKAEAAKWNDKTAPNLNNPVIHHLSVVLGNVRKPQNKTGSAKGFLIACTKSFIEPHFFPPEVPCLSIWAYDFNNALKSRLARTFSLWLASSNASCILPDLFSCVLQGSMH